MSIHWPVKRERLGRRRLREAGHASPPDLARFVEREAPRLKDHLRRLAGEEDGAAREALERRLGAAARGGLSAADSGALRFWRLRSAEKMLQQMNTKCRRVFLLHVVEECSYADIAERLDMTLSAVEQELTRAFEICANWDEGGQGLPVGKTR